MDRVTEALQRARSLSPVAQPAPQPAPSVQSTREVRSTRSQRVSSLFQRDGSLAIAEGGPQTPAHAPSPERLVANNIVSFDKSDRRSTAFDILRNHVLNMLRGDGTQVIGITAPTVGCGATVTAANLAFSLARKRSQTVVVVDVKPRSGGLADVLCLPRAGAGEDGSELVQRVRAVRAGGAIVNLLSVPADGDPVAFIEAVKRDLRPDILLLDMPPMLGGDDATHILPLADLVLMVMAVGRSTVAELETCKSYMPSGTAMQVVMNKARPHGM